MKLRTALGYLLALVVIAGMGYSAFHFHPPTPTSATGAATTTIALGDIGVRITVPPALSSLTYQAQNVESVGTVLSMQTPAVKNSDGSNCELGSMYLLPKSQLSTLGLTDNDLRARAVSQGDVPPQVKEFSDAYFVFEPSQTTCTQDPVQTQTESQLRLELWESVPTAELM